MTTRSPRTPDCAVGGCNRAARGAGLCDRHRAMVPLRERVRAKAAILSAQMQGTRAERARLAGLAAAAERTTAARD